jgi:hypothetical protein
MLLGGDDIVGCGMSNDNEMRWDMNLGVLMDVTRRVNLFY